MRIFLLGNEDDILVGECKRVLSEEHEVVEQKDSGLKDITWDRVIDTLEKVSPDVVIKCSSLLDLSEKAEDRDADLIEDVEGPRNLAQGCARFRCKMLYISGPHVFDGKKVVPQPYFEDDSPSPQSSFGRSKMESESAVVVNSSESIVLRTGWLYGFKGERFIRPLLNKAMNSSGSLKIINDQIGSPTWDRTIAGQIKELLKNGMNGTYHATAEGYCSKLECARFVLEKLGLKVSVEPRSVKNSRETEKTPMNCLLENRLLKKQGMNLMRDWKYDLGAFLEEFGDELLREIEMSGSAEG